MSSFGYAGKILRIDLSSGKISEMSTSDYSGKFLGGRGIAAKIYWDEVPPEVGATDPDNRLIFATGPLAGVPVIAGSRWTICGKSPEPVTDKFSYGNLGGRWGAGLKFAGYDAVVVQGQSDIPVYLFIHDGIAELRDAIAIWGKGAIETREIIKGELGNSSRVVAIGPAGENMVVIASMLADNDAVCTGGMGAVMGSKKLKAIVVAGGSKRGEVAEPDRLRELTKYYRDLGRGFVEYLARWSRDLVREFRLMPGPEMKKEPCYGCLGNCCRKVYQAQDGSSGKFMCHSAFFYQPYAERYYGDWNEVPFYATKLCDTYGLDAVAVDLIVNWLQGCYQSGVLTDDSTGMPLSKLGSQEFIESLVMKISKREGFGDLLAQGIEAAAEAVGAGGMEQLGMAGYLSEPGNDVYGPRLYLTNSFLYAMEPRIPIQQLHEVGLLIPGWATWARINYGYLTSDVVRAIAKRFWGSELAADFSTDEGKALAAKMIQDRQYAKECLILCDYIWPITSLPNTEDHIGDPTLESKLLSAVTGNEVDEYGLYRIGERVFNLQRAILTREGHRGRDFDSLPDRCYTIPLDYDISNIDCLVPGKDGEVLSRKGKVVDKDQFERMKDEYYEIRQWDVATGLQTGETLNNLGLTEVAEDLAKRGLLASGDGY